MVRIGMIGTGSTFAIADYHAEALQRIPEAKITALFSRRRESAMLFAKKHRLDARVCDTYAQALEAADCVCICSPNSTHAAYAMQALREKKGVLCEKPLGGSEEELLRLEKLARETAVCNMVAYNTRYSPEIKLLKRLMGAGAIGRVFWYREKKGGNRLADPRVPYEWRMESGQGGSMMDFTSHMLDHFLFLTGQEPGCLRRGHAVYKTFIPERPDGAGCMKKVLSDDYSQLALEDADGAEVSLTSSRVGIPFGGIELVGENGMAYFSEAQPRTVYYWEKKQGRFAAEPEKLAVEGAGDTFFEQDRAFIRAVMERKGIAPGLPYGCALLKFLKQTMV